MNDFGKIKNNEPNKKDCAHETTLNQRKTITRIYQLYGGIRVKNN